jgi:hypothetical protein
VLTAKRSAVSDLCTAPESQTAKTMDAIGVKGVASHSFSLKPWTLIDLKLSSAFRRAFFLIEQR